MWRLRGMSVHSAVSCGCRMRDRSGVFRSQRGAAPGLVTGLDDVLRIRLRQVCLEMWYTSDHMQLAKEGYKSKAAGA